MGDSTEPVVVLYVEDNPANFSLVRKVLEVSKCYRVEGAMNAEEGLDAARRLRPQLVLLDLDLPGTSGIELARLLKADRALADIPLVAISASVMKRERDEALAAGCCCFIEKPFDIRHLRRTVESVLAGASVP